MTKQEILEKFKDYPTFQIKGTNNKQIKKILQEIQKTCKMSSTFNFISVLYVFDLQKNEVNCVSSSNLPKMTNQKLLEIWNSDNFEPVVGEEYEFSDDGYNWIKQVFITKIKNVYVTVNHMYSFETLMRNQECVDCVPYVKIREISTKKFTKQQAIEIIAKSEKLDKTKIEII